MRLRFLTRLTAALLFWPAVTFSQAPADTPPAGDPRSITPDAWAFERVALEDGRSFRGLIDSEDDTRVEFIEVRQPEGRPMYLVSRPIAVREIRSIDRLPAEQHERLRQQIDSFRNRMGYEQGRMESIVLRTLKKDGVQYRLFDDGVWFTLQSTADDEMTRRCVLRIEQIFASYRRILPPRSVPAKSSHNRITFLLFGSSGEYRAYLAAQDLQIENPAFFVKKENLVVAGSELNRYSEQLAEVRREHERLLQQQTQRAAQLPGLLDQLSKTFQQQGMPQPERERILVAYSKAWEDEAVDLERRVRAAERRNVDEFDRVAARMFRRLFHEAFHAYLENYVYPSEACDVPRWLNEGLAQVFEGGVLDGDILRLDAPSPAKLQLLRAELNSGRRLSLAEVLSAGEQKFLVAHAGGVQASMRHYLYSWGLAWYLVFGPSPAAATALDEYVDPAAALRSPTARFERLVQMDLAEFEREWIAEMLKVEGAKETAPRPAAR